MNDQSSNTLYKLMLLYMLGKIDFSMTYSQIADFILEKGYTDFFTLQSSINELTDADLIHEEKIRDTTYYTITPEGEKTIGYFHTRLSLPLREDIDLYLKENKMALIDHSSVQSDYYLRTSGSYEVQCTVLEKQERLIDLKLTVTDEEMAKAICSQWKEKCQAIYAYIMQQLMT